MDRPLRRLMRSPGFSSLAIAILALGLGAALAVFEVADAVLLRPLPFAAPQQLVTVWQTNNGTRITLDGAGIVAVLATLLPARRAARVDPAVALRAE